MYCHKAPQKLPRWKAGLGASSQKGRIWFARGLEVYGLTINRSKPAGSAHFRMASGEEYLASISLLASDPRILQANPLPFSRYIDERPEEQPVVFTTYNAPAILSRAPLPLGDRARR